MPRDPVTNYIIDPYTKRTKDPKTGLDTNALENIDY
jgi:hypothetical protein